ncbi:hypothetical protein IJD34_07060 [bacterium]|nr:hypothetical protein [bacterium]
MTNFERFKQALKRRKEEEYAKLQLEVKKMKETIEKMLTKIFECTANQAKTNYSGLEMY